jgi:hypothetical protein
LQHLHGDGRGFNPLSSDQNFQEKILQERSVGATAPKIDRMSILASTCRREQKWIVYLAINLKMIALFE